MLYVKELLLPRPLHVLLHRRCSWSCCPAKAETLCFPFEHSISAIIRLIDRGAPVHKLVTLFRFNNSVLASISQVVVEIVIDSIVMATILADFALVRGRMYATLLLRAFDLLFLFMYDLRSRSLLHNLTPFRIVLLLRVPLNEADSFLTEFY